MSIPHSDTHKLSLLRQQNSFLFKTIKECKKEIDWATLKIGDCPKHWLDLKKKLDLYFDELS